MFRVMCYYAAEGMINRNMQIPIPSTITKKKKKTIEKLQLAPTAIVTKIYILIIVGKFSFTQFIPGPYH